MPVEFNKRKLLSRIGSGTLSSASFSRITASEKGSQGPIERIAIEVAASEQRKLMAFTATEGNVIRLYVALGTTSVEQQADEISKLALPDEGSVLDIRWNENSLRFWQNGTVYEARLTGKGEIAAVSRVRDQTTPKGITVPPKSDQVTTEDNLDPGGGGGDEPDWFGDSDLYRDPVEECRTADFGELCISTGEVSPKFNVNCNGKEVPVVGLAAETLSGKIKGVGASVSLNFWIGYDISTGCVYAGVPEDAAREVCLSNCDVNLNDDFAAVESKVSDELRRSVESLEGLILDEFSDPTDIIETVIDIIVVIMILIILAILHIVTAGGYGA